MRTFSKKILSLVMSLALISSLVSTQAFAATKQSPSSVAAISGKYGITEDEIVNLDKNLDKALLRAKEIESASKTQDGKVISVPVSPNLVLELATHTESKTQQAKSALSLNSTREITVWGDLYLKNIAGVTIITLTSTGVFDVDGVHSTCVDAYGNYDAGIWDVEVTSSTYTSSYARNSFKGSFDIGIDPVHQRIQSFQRTGVVRCQPSGTGSCSWS